VIARLVLNGRARELEVRPSQTLLDVLRDTLGNFDVKEGCDEGVCGACTVHVNGKAVRSCQTGAGQVVGQEVTTIEGLGGTHPVQEAWRDGDVPECGYCQPGQIMAVAALLAKKPNPTDADITSEMTNLCRCGTYSRMRDAIHRAAQLASRR